MPPRIDPYANKTHKRIDTLLIVITIVLMVFAFRMSAHQRATSAEPTRTAQSQANH